MKNEHLSKLKKHTDLAYIAGFLYLTNHLQYMYKANQPKVKCIINAMGEVAFYNKNGALWTHEEEKLKGYSKLQKFLSDWDDRFHFTGDPWRIDEKGIRTDW
jgi:hypothetical protein